MMRVFILMCCVCFLVSCSASGVSKDVPEKQRLSLSSDSGYICAGEAFGFLVSNMLIDTIRINNTIRCAYAPDWQSVGDSSAYYMEWYDEPADTIGKYYVFESTGNYLIAISWDREILLLELDTEGEVIGCGMTGHGSYACCWNDFNDMLKKYDCYMGVATCGTGLAYCSKYVMFFKDQLKPDAASIPFNEFAGSFGEVPGHILSSTLEFINDSLIMHYEVEKFLWDENDDEAKIISTSFFMVTYVYKNDTFETDEEHKFEGLLY